MWSFIKSFVPAWLATFLVASSLHTFQVLKALSSLGVEISFPEWLSTAWKDIVGLLPTYGIIIAIALLLAFSVVTIIRKYAMKHKVTKPRFITLTSVAGATSIAVALLAMQPILNVTLIAGARGYDGFLYQCFAGLLGGFIYGLLRVTITSRPLSNS
ncbi:conserved membrane hypothetical protein [Alteromonas sp. 38]|uniref:hypothetical protein n=1 Tax=unclassified Alteromonas TaxID=2614992 RepID=UPI0012F192F1|nr:MULTISPECIES: hypothetical protein [unclassified Alteromonas]CAD5290952.1 conserved membrane hypothetical protein [Alteromonas sp. 154]VXB22940.1 conserved membrane hypothetical protein [Alteromonas sp. 38]